MFRLSKGVIQLNYFIHEKIVVNVPLRLITFIDKTRKTNTYRMDDVAQSSSLAISDLIERLPYVADVVSDMMG